MKYDADNEDVKIMVDKTIKPNKLEIKGVSRDKEKLLFI